MIATLIRDAIAWSQTFRRLAQTIDASDGLVYVESGECRNYLEACLVSVTVSGPYRVLQVRVHSRTADRHLMASIGHELPHAVEVLSSAAVKDNAAMHMFYAREGRRGSQGFETDAAIEAGDAVRAEVRRYAPLSEAR